jgi:acetyl-CoA synthetase
VAKTSREPKLPVPFRVTSHFNFATDVIDKWAKDRNRLAIHYVSGDMTVEKKLTFFEVSLASCRIANVLVSHGVNKGDRVMVMLPRIPQW